MEIIRLPNKIDIQNLGLCLGNFDGLHIGHQKLLREARKNNPGPVGVLLFDKNPAEFIKNNKSLDVLTGLEDKIRLLSTLQIDYVFVVEVSREFFALSKRQFIDDVLGQIKPVSIYCGPDYRFGEKASGTPKDLAERFEVHEVSLLEVDGAKVSSQNIIQLIHDGEIEKASLLLGRPYEVSGTVVEGFGNGKSISFPTANLSLKYRYALPKTGVYSGFTYVLGVPKLSMINVGTNPTVGKLERPIVESHLIRYEGTLYGKFLYVSFEHFIRNEKIFANLGDLKSQLQMDLAKICELY